MKRLICIDAGHGGGATGAVYGGHYEKDIVMNVALWVQSLLEISNYSVVMTRSNDSFVGLQQRCEIANMSDADIFVSIHVNADPDEDKECMPQAKGEEIWVHGAGWDLARHLQGPINSIFPEHPFRGIRQTSKLHVLKHTKMPAVLIELGFMDNNKELLGLTHSSSYKKIASLIVRGIREFYADY